VKSSSTRHRLNNIASDLLVLSDLESGGAMWNRPVSVEDAINTAILTVEAEARDPWSESHSRSRSDVSITGYALRLEQALVNLLDNAVNLISGGEAGSSRSAADACQHFGPIPAAIRRTICRVSLKVLSRGQGRSREVRTGLGVYRPHVWTAWKAYQSREPAGKEPRLRSPFCQTKIYAA